MYATYSDKPDEPEKSHIQNILYTSIPSYTTSDHVRSITHLLSVSLIDSPFSQKPIVTVLAVPTSITSVPITPARSSPPQIQLPSTFTPTPDRHWNLKRNTGRMCDRIIGSLWTILWVIGLGNAAVGLANFAFSLLAWRWMNSRNQPVLRTGGEA